MLPLLYFRITSRPCIGYGFVCVRFSNNINSEMISFNSIIRYLEVNSDI